ncbi:DNA polymerase III subunit alpha [Mycoplasma sp. NEAQ87857]|uniref:DNA polymerase III subunit alpha n=1 Tax=Mycoplasma sp. NEAQ87857 TaxID=2683967 RepID=UPI001318AF63|nr:DNA polymerase III subunit alpha [Mycoplasma sp. NEAQ87857]QGZ97202.1 DNA polymerase III subunit alpha [Mycoplasma sp. NEAQ87857]
MQNKIFLHTNTEYSFLNSTIRVNELFKYASDNDIKYLPLTDINNLYALPLYLELSKQYNIKPIIGLQTSIVNDDCKFDVILIAKNNNGLKLLNQIIYQASKNIFVKDLNDLESDDLYIIDHYENGMVANNYDFKVPNNFFYNSNELVYPNTVYAPTKRIMYQNQNNILNVLDNIAGKQHKINYQFKDYNDVNFELLDSNIYQNMQNIIDSLEPISLDSKIKLANYKEDVEDTIKRLIVGKKYLNLIKYYDKDLVDKRINYEYQIIKKLGFINYFLIIWDTLNFARSQGIEVGPGRGSASGSLISYLLDITDVNPLEFNLLFERFLNPDRVSLPDIDIDIQDNRRDEVLEYIRNKYGHNKVALITTFQTLASKNSIRDVGRYLNIPTPSIDKISNSLTKNDLNLEYAYAHNKKYKILVDEFENLHHFASLIEGLPRQTGLHAAGIVISNVDLTNSFPVEQNANGFNQIQFTLNNLEQYGLIKIDFLGLKNLTVINQIESLIPEKYHFNNIINQNYSQFSDQETFNLLNKLLTDGVFQLESNGMRAAIKSVKIDSFDDLYAIISLYRPGPMQYIDTYAKNKQDPSLVEKIHPLYDKIVEPTYGIIVYQEQIMQIAQQVANMSFAQSDLLRRAISKKDDKKLHSYKKIFFESGFLNNIPIDVLEKIYQKIELFAAYGFNKSHAVAYALISYKLAFYKARFPKIFFKVLISNAIGDLTTVKKYVLDAKEQGVSIFSPIINISTNTVEIKDNNLYLPLNMIKGIGLVATNKIIEETNKGEFSHFISCYLRLRNAGIGESVINTLIKANVFRKFANCATLEKNTVLAQQYFDLFSKEIKQKKITDEILKDQELANFIQRYKINEQKLQFVEKNVSEEMKNESELLGDIYNAMAISTDNKVVRPSLSTLPINENRWIDAYLISVKKHPTKKQVNIAIMDVDNKSINAYGFNEKTLLLLENKEPRQIMVYIKNNGRYFTINDWKDNNETN